MAFERLVPDRSIRLDVKRIRQGQFVEFPYDPCDQAGAQVPPLCQIYIRLLLEPSQGAGAEDLHAFNLRMPAKHAANEFQRLRSQSEAFLYSRALCLSHGNTCSMTAR